MAKQVLGMFTNMNMIANYMKLFKPPSAAAHFDAGIDGATAYTWSDGEVTYWLVYYETTDKYVWKLDADLGSGRKPFIYVEETKDEKSGQADFHVPGYNDIHSTWSYDNDDNLTVEVNYQDTEGNIRIQAVINQDGSGNMKYYVDDQLLMSAQWNADGSGSWTIYTEGGELTGQWSSGK